MLSKLNIMTLSWKGIKKGWMYLSEELDIWICKFNAYNKGNLCGLIKLCLDAISKLEEALEVNPRKHDTLVPGECIHGQCISDSWSSILWASSWSGIVN